MPDFDIDFCQGNRDRVIEYVKDKYGRDAVSQIATFGTMAARRDPRRRPRARHELHLLRRHQQADSEQAGQARHDRRGDRRHEPIAERSGCEKRGRGQDAAGAGAEARRHDAQHRHARGRRADRAGQAHRLLPAVPAAGQRLGGEPVRQGRRRGRRPGEVRLPGPDHADHPRAAPRTSSSRATRARRTSPSRTSPLDDRAHLRAVLPTARPWPCSSSKVARHAGHAEGRAARRASRT